MRTVLLVDDEYAIVEAVKELLEIEGYRVVTATNGESALRELERAQPDVVVTDVMMPFVDGLELLRRMRADARWARLPVVLVSAAPSTFDHPSAQLASLCLRKPFEIEQLVAAIERSVAG